MLIRRDYATGAALIALGAAMAIGASGFPNLGGMRFGPDLFPTIVAAGLALSGAGVLLEAWRGTAPEESGGGGALAPFLGLIALVALFALSLDWLGFLIAACLAFLAAGRIFGGSWRLCFALAIAGPFILHFVFYSIMRVALPWGF